MRALFLVLGAFLFAGCEADVAFTEQPWWALAMEILFVVVIPLASAIVRYTKTKRDDLWLGRILPLFSVLDPDKGTKLPLAPLNPPPAEK